MKIDLPLVCVIIPCHNGLEHTKITIAKVLKSDYANFKVLLVDDGSSDGTNEFISTEYPEVVILEGDGNLWWTGAINLGCRKAVDDFEADYILFLNNDVLIEKSAISNLVENAIKNPFSIIGSAIYEVSNPNKIWSYGGIMKWPWPGEVQLDSNGETSLKELKSVEWTPGMGTLVVKSLLKKLNYLDDKNMPQYLSDVDFCLRAKKLGYEILVSPDSRIYNNIENTGGIIDRKILYFSDIKFIFSNLRSAEYFPARLRFILRHCTWYLIIPAIFIRYSRIFLYVARRLSFKINCNNTND